MKRRSGRHTTVDVDSNDIFITATNMQLHLDQHRRDNYLSLNIHPRDMVQKPIVMVRGTTRLVISFRLAKQIKRIVDRVSYEDI